MIEYKHQSYGVTFFKRPLKNPTKEDLYVENFLKTLKGEEFLGCNCGCEEDMTKLHGGHDPKCPAAIPF